MVVTDDVPEPATQQQPPRVERALVAPVAELDRRPRCDGGTNGRQLRALGYHCGHRRALVIERSTELPDGVLAGLAADSSDRHLQCTHLVGRQVEVAELVGTTVDPIGV